MIGAIISAAAGSTAGFLGTFQSKNRQWEELKKQKDIEKDKFKYGKEFSDKIFELQKAQALDHLFMQKQNLDTQMNLSVNEYNTELLAQAFGIQDARIQSDSAIGASYLSEGASGTRGNNANNMMRDYAKESFERNIDVHDRQSSEHLNRMITGGNIAATGINKERDSWLEGGFRYQEKLERDLYNKKIYDLNMKEFNRQIELSNPWAITFDNFLDYNVGLMGGANTGLQFGKSLEYAFDHRR